MDPFDWFVYDQFFDPGKYQCGNCGALFDEDDQCIEWNDEDRCFVYECSDCGATGRISE